MAYAIHNEWKFKLLAINSGRTFVKNVIADTYAEAEAFAKSCVPAVNGPVIVLSYQ